MLLGILPNLLRLQVSHPMDHGPGDAERPGAPATGSNEGLDTDGGTPDLPDLSEESGRPAGFLAGHTGGAETQSEPAVGPGESRPRWRSNRPIDDNLSAGDIVTFTKPVTAADVQRFALAGGNTAPRHLREAAGSEAPPAEIPEGLLAALVTSALSRLPGVERPRSMTLDFPEPAPVGDTLTAEARVVDTDRADLIHLRVEVHSTTATVAVGEATVTPADSEAGPEPGDSEDVTAADAETAADNGGGHVDATARQ